MDSSKPQDSAPASADATGEPSNIAQRLQRREKAALDSLRTLIRDFYGEQLVVLPGEKADLEIALRLKTRPSEKWELRFDPPLYDQLAPQLQEYQAARNVFLPGSVYCYRCDSSACEHAEPPSPLSVFVGYSSTGIAEWKDCAQAFIDLKDERVDQLFVKNPSVLALVQLGRELKAQQLASFGRSSKTYAILGQVIAGYFRLPKPSNPSAQRLALTFQLVETRGADWDFHLQLNVLARLPNGADLAELLSSGWEPALARAREEAAWSIERMEKHARQAREAGRKEEAQSAMQQVPSILRRLAESLERGSRQGQRRTRHVEQRRHEQRPVNKALDDASAAPDEAVFFDEKTEAFVACGPQGRAHVFNAEGRHITSLFLKPDSVEFRLRTSRWRAATPEEARAFRARLQTPGAVAAGEA